MNLKQYCETNNLKLKELAKKLNLSAAFITQLVNGSRRPSPAVALKIEEETNGKVTRMELLYPSAEEPTNNAENQAASNP